jgi:ATP-dependent DNA ligase
MFQTLYGRSKQNKLLYWKIWIKKEAKGVEVYTEYGEVETAKPQYTKPNVFTKGKNIGKSNETTPFQQASQFAQRKWLDKRDKQGYSTSMNISPKLYPMLANPLNASQMKKIEFPACAQPKLDGVRCIAYLEDRKVKLFSRTGAEFTGLWQISRDIERILKLYPNLVLDGELGSFPSSDKSPEMTFQETCGYVKRKTKKPDDPEQSIIEFRVFDVFERDEPQTWMIRYETLSNIRDKFSLERVKIIETRQIMNNQEFMDYHSSNVSRGFEGTIYRKLSGIYRPKYRSKDLLKYKDMITEEYPIVGFQEGRGNDVGTIVWKVDVQGKTTKVRPKGSREYRRQLFENAVQYIGKKLTVQYQELTDDGLPRFPVGIVVRDYE